MKNKWLLLAAAAALYGCGGQASQGSAQTETSQEEVQQAEAPRTPLSGGYTASRPLKADEQQLFDRLTAQIDSVKYTAQSVATQVVAGKNYRYLCRAVPKTGDSYPVELVIYQPLPNQGDPRITRITPCSEQ